MFSNNNVWIIAEIGSNHMQDLTCAKDHIYEAKACGATHVKLQVYTPHMLWSDEHLAARGELYNLNREHLPDLITYAYSVDIGIGVTFFDRYLLHQYAELPLDFIKIASGSIKDSTLRQAAQTISLKYSLPLIVSVPTNKIVPEKDLEEVIRKELVALLVCSTSYPTATWKSGIQRVQTFKHVGYPFVGYSDHTLSDMTGALVVAKGGRILEKHFKLEHINRSPDAQVSVEPKVFRRYVENVREAMDQEILPYPDQGELEDLVTNEDGLRRKQLI